MSFHCLSDGTIVVVSLSHADLGAKAVFLLPIACLAMKPDDVVVQLKRNGSFDQLRKQLLTDFQNEVPTDLQVLMVKLMGFILAWRKSISCQDQQLYGVHDSQGSYATGKGPIGIPFVGNEWTGKVRSVNTLLFSVMNLSLIGKACINQSRSKFLETCYKRRITKIRSMSRWNKFLLVVKSRHHHDVMQWCVGFSRLLVLQLACFSTMQPIPNAYSETSS